MGVSTKSIHTRHVVGHDSKVVATNVAASAPVTVGHGAPVHGSRGPAHAVVGAAVHHPGKREAEAEPEADAGVVVPHAVPHHAAVIGPVPAPAVHVDVTTIEDCEEVITTHCSQTQQSVAHASNV